MIAVVSFIVLLRGFPCFHDFWHGVSHPYIAIHSRNDFYTCSTYILWLAYKRSYAHDHEYMYI